MNEVDAARFFHACGTKRVAPYHVEMFDDKTPCIFYDEKMILKTYKEREI